MQLCGNAKNVHGQVGFPAYTGTSVASCLGGTTQFPPPPRRKRERSGVEMSKLHEQYEALRRRGMPEHLRLSWQSAVEWNGVVEAVPGWWVLQDLPLDHTGGGAISPPEEDVNDLLSMHALRWLLEREDPPIFSHCPKCPEGMDYSFMWNREAGDWDGHGTNILDAIMAATAHLEPKAK